MEDRPKPTLVGTFFVPTQDGDYGNVQQLIGAVEILNAFVREHGLRVVGVGEEASKPVETAEQQRRGRKPGSTNWTQERFWRKYRKAADQMARPYKRTHFAARLGLVYNTFTNYLERWGPPPGYAAPGD